MAWRYRSRRDRVLHRLRARPDDSFPVIWSHALHPAFDHDLSFPDPTGQRSRRDSERLPGPPHDTQDVHMGLGAHVDQGHVRPIGVMVRKLFHVTMPFSSTRITGAPRAAA